MSRGGAPTIPDPIASTSKVAIVAASWHQEVMDGLIAGAVRALARCGLHDVPVIRVPGTFELPVVCAALAHAGYDAVVALGVVVRGETPHFDYVCSAASAGLTQVAISTGVPIGFGVLTCDTDAQALDRAGLEHSSEDKGAEAAMAAVTTALTIEQVRAAPELPPTSTWEAPDKGPPFRRNPETPSLQ